MKYHFKVRKDIRGGFWAQCLELDGCLTEANSESELRKNMAEALYVYLDEPTDSKIIFPKPKSGHQKKRGVVAVPVEPAVAFAMLLRQARVKRELSIRAAAKALGMSSPSEYFKLESGKSANPVFSTLVKIKRVFPDLDIEEALAA